MHKKDGFSGGKVNVPKDQKTDLHLMPQEKEEIIHGGTRHTLEDRQNTNITEREREIQTLIIA